MGKKDTMNKTDRTRVNRGWTGRVLSWLLVLALTLGTISGSLLMQGDRAYAAADSTRAPIRTGTYQFASNETMHGNILGTDTFQYSDRLFTGSSYEVNRHLATLSANTALSTASYYNEKDNLERNNASNSQNAKALLGAYGFTDIQTNTYYDKEKEANSAGCIVGHKTIIVGGKPYTLLAVIPRSAGYKQEWTGNFTVGTGSIHQGFKAARDEVLRFVKNYISNNKITGDLKVWITGHSRGGAIANLLGGFFAEGGGGYFNGVKIDSKNVYCYSWATPGTIRENAVKKADALSVDGYRGDNDARYKDDSKGAKYTYSGADANTEIDPHTGVYQCIKNCAPGYDIITQLPPKKWGYECYGEELPITDGAAATKEKMKTELNKFAPFAYKEYTEPKDDLAPEEQTEAADMFANGDEGSYHWKTFDFATLTFKNIKDPKQYGDIDQETMFSSRINQGLAHRASDVDAYVDGGYQETLQALAGIYGMGVDEFIAGLTQDKEAALKAAAFSYLSYAKDQLKAADKDLTDADAIAKTVAQLLEYITGKPFHYKLTKDEQVSEGKTYYTRSGSGTTEDPYVYTAVASPVNEEISTYYEYTESFTVDDVFLMITQYIVDNTEQYDVDPVDEEDFLKPENGKDPDTDPYVDPTIKVTELRFKSKIAEEVFNGISNLIITAIPEEYRGMIQYLVPGYDGSQSIDSDTNKRAIANFVFGMLVQCAYGYDEETGEPSPESAAGTRYGIYGLLAAFMGEGDYKDIIDAIGKNGDADYDGSGEAGKFLEALMGLLMVEKDEDGGILFKYDSVDAAATSYLKKIIDNGKEELLASGRYDSGSVYYRDVINHCKTLKKRATQLRQLLMDLLFYEDDGSGKAKAFSAEDNIRMVSTFAAQYRKVACAHYNELYVAWMRAQDSAMEYIAPELIVSKVTTKAKTGKKQMVVSWQDARDANDYQITYRQAGKKWTKKWTGGKTAITLNNMKKNGLYQFKVMGVRRDGANMEKGKWSAVSYRFFAASKERLQAKKKTVIVRVNRVSAATGYQVMYGTDKALSDKITRGFKGAKKTRLKISGLKKSRRYYVCARPYKNYKGHKYIGIKSAKKKVKAK